MSKLERSLRSDVGYQIKLEFYDPNIHPSLLESLRPNYLYKSTHRPDAVQLRQASDKFANFKENDPRVFWEKLWCGRIEALTRQGIERFAVHVDATPKSSAGWLLINLVTSQVEEKVYDLRADIRPSIKSCGTRRIDGKKVLFNRRDVFRKSPR